MIQAKIDIAGFHGRDGMDGKNGVQWGECGANAGPSEGGGNGGQAYLRLHRVQRNENSLHVTGTVHNQPFDQTFELGPVNQLIIDARGGNGGRGGHGGNGARGRDGHDGQDATKYSAGTNGGPGLPGGNGGNATSGQNGGNGGFIQIIVAEEDMDLLLMLAPLLVKGGSGGTAGRNGSGGIGGSGGRGGDGCSWTTTVETSYTDSNGNYRTKTHYHNHHNPGGSNGPDGPNGYPGNAPILPGRDGLDGAYEFIVEHPSGPMKYSEKYDIQMTDFSIMFPEEDDVIEPGEQAFVTAITLYNNGLMPSPIHQDLYVSVTDNINIEGIGSLMIPRILAPQQSVTVPFSLGFKIRYPQRVNFGIKHYEVIGHTNVQLFSPSVNRFIPTAVKAPPKLLNIRFPLQLEQFQCLRTFAPGQQARVLFTLFNHSLLDIGGAQRPAQIRLTAGQGQFDATKIEFNFDGREKNLVEPYVYDLPEIKAKSRIVIDAQIKIPQDAGFLLKAQFISYIYLADPRNTEVEPNPCIHFYPYDIRTGFIYSKRPDQDLVFIISEKTHLEEVKFIQKMCSYFMLKENFYDITMTGTLDLFTPLPGSETSLAQDLKGKTLVLINNDFIISSTALNVVTAWTFDYLQKSQLMKAVAEYDVHFVIFSPHVQNYLEWALQASHNPKLHASPDEFLKAEYTLQEKTPFGERICISDAVNVTKGALAMGANTDIVTAATADLIDKVQQRFPYMNYVAVPVVKETPLTKQIGQVLIFRTVPLITQHLSFFDFSAFLTRHVDFCIGILLSVDIKKRALALLNIAQIPEPMADLKFALEQSILLTLGREFQTGVNSKHSRKFFFTEFSEFIDVVKDTLKKEKTWNLNSCEDFFLRLRLMAKRQARLKDTLFFWVAHAKLLNQLSKKLKSLIQCMGKEDKEVKQRRDLKLKTFEEQYLLRKKQFPEVPKWVKHTQVDLSTTTFKAMTIVPKILAQSDLDEIVNKENMHNHKCAQIIAIKKQLDAQLEV